MAGKAKPQRVEWWRVWAWPLPAIAWPKRVWGITDIVGISDAAWSKLSWMATGVGTLAMAVNFVMVVAYAAGVAIDAPMLSLQGKDALWAHVINVAVAAGAICVAGMLQLGTDFGLLGAAGLAKGKYKFTPTAAMILWVICAANTIEMKRDLYEAVRDGRIAELQEAADTRPPAVEQAYALLAPYAVRDGAAGLPAPPTVQASQATITAATLRLSDLAAERIDKLAARDAETQTGRGSKWDGFDARILDIDAEMTTRRDDIAAASRAAEARKEFDKAVSATTLWEARAKVEVSGLGYDDAWAIELRVWGMSLLGIVGLLVGFAADKQAEDLRKAEAEREKRSRAGVRGAETRAANANTFDAEFGEAAPLGAPQLSSKALHEGEMDRGSVKTPRRASHPDKAGDDFGARRNGHSETEQGGGDGDAEI